MNHIKTFLTATTALTCIAGVASATTVTLESNSDLLATATLSADSGISIVDGSSSLIGEDQQQGTFTDFNEPSADPTQSDLAIADGIVLTTGNANFSTDTNTSNSFAGSAGTGGFQPLIDLADANGLSASQKDSNVLSFDFILDDPTQNAVTAQFLFATEEFPTQAVTDIFGIFVNGENFAFFPNGDLVSNQDGDPNEFFNSNEFGSDNFSIEHNGLTDVFDVTALALGNGLVNTIEIAIADTNDPLFDSAVFFSGLTGAFTDTDGGIGPLPPIADTDPNVVPLPAAGWMLLAGLGGLGTLRRRRNS